MFDKMSDKDFDKYMKFLKEGKTQIHIYTSNFSVKIDQNTLFELLDKNNIIYEDSIEFQDKTIDRKYTGVKKVIVLDIPVRRVKQYLLGKISIPESDTRIHAFSGQVMKPDKGAKISLIETQILANKNLETSVLELLKIRGGDLDAYYQYKNKIEETGRTSVNEIDDNSVPKSVIVNQEFLYGAHLDFNFVDK